MLALFETPAGYAIFEVLKPKVLKDIDSINDNFLTAEKAKKMYVFFPAFRGTHKDAITF